jgi:hypothetical protein
MFPLCADYVRVFLIMCAAIACAQGSALGWQVMNSSDATFASIPRPYADIEAARATWVYHTKGPDGAARVRRSTTSVARDGRFGNTEHQFTQDRPSPADQFPVYFVFGDGARMWSAYGEGSRYTETTLPKVPGVLDPPPQCGRAPWARVGAWLDEFSSREISPTALGDGWRFEASDIGRPGTFALEVGPKGEVLAFELGVDQERLRWEYDNFQDVQGVPIPRLMRHITIRADGSREARSGEATLERFERDTPEVVNALAFDPVALNVRYFDEATGEVRSPDKSTHLFTIDSGGDSGRSSGRWWSRVWLLGVIAAMGASGWAAWKRWRGAT